MPGAPRRRRHGLAGFLACAALIAACAAKPDPASLAERTFKAQTLLDTHYGNSTNLEEAGRLLDTVLRDAPDYAPAHAQAARVVIMDGHIVGWEFSGNTLEHAESILLKARQLDPQYAETHSLLGHVLTLAGKYAEAEAALTEADRLGSTNPWTQVNWGHLYQQQGKMREAQLKWLSVFEAGRMATPQELRSYIAAIEFQRHMLVRAGPAYAPQVKELGAMATAVAPANDAWTWGNFANDLVILGEFDAAIPAARTALSRMNYGVGRATLARALIGKWAELSATGPNAEAEKYFAEAAEVYPNLGALLERIGGSTPKHQAAKRLLRERLERP